MEGFPIRITIVRISKELNVSRDLIGYHEKMPLTSAAVRAEIETKSQRNERKVAWAAKQFLQVGIVPTLRELASKAKVSYRRSPKIHVVLRFHCFDMERQLTPY